MKQFVERLNTAIERAENLFVVPVLALIFCTTIIEARWPETFTFLTHPPAWFLWVWFPFLACLALGTLAMLLRIFIEMAIEAYRLCVRVLRS